MGGGHIPGVIPLAVEDVFQTIKNVIKCLTFYLFHIYYYCIIIKYVLLWLLFIIITHSCFF